MSTDREILKQALVGTYLSVGMVDAAGEVGKMSRRSFTAQITDGGTAGTAQAEVSLGNVLNRGKVVAVYVTLPVTATAHASNIATFTVAKRTAGTSATVASGSTVTAGMPGTITAWVPAVIPLTAANVQLTANDILTVAVAKGASGVAIASSTASGVVTVIVEEN